MLLRKQCIYLTVHNLMSRLIKMENTIIAQLLTKTSTQHMKKHGFSIFGVLMFAVFMPTAGADISTEPDKEITITSTPNTSMSSEMKDECLLAYAKQGDMEQIKQMIASGANINCSDEWGRTPLFNAAAYGHSDCVKLLLESGADIAASDSVLAMAAGSGNPECVRILIEAGADVNLTTGSDKWTPLHFAAFNGHCECVKLLIAKGAKINSRDIDGETPLTKAYQSGCKECIKRLKAAGAKR